MIHHNKPFNQSNSRCLSISTAIIFTIIVLFLNQSYCYPDPYVETSRYHHQDDLESLLNRYQTDFPHISRLHKLGSSVQGRAIWAIQITDAPEVVEAGEQWVKYVGNMHGNEVVGREILLTFIEYLLEGYGANETITEMIDNMNIWIVPTMNPDGFEAGVEGTCCGGTGRFNHDGVDLNRDFLDGKRAKETEMMKEFITTYSFTLSINFHGGALVANYPYDSQVGGIKTHYAATPDDGVFKHLARVYSDNHPYMFTGNDIVDGTKCGGRYQFPDGGITNGNYWYTVEGGMQDFNYLNSNAYELTVELGTCKYPHAKDLPRFFVEHRPALIEFFRQITLGVGGFVRDAKTGRGIQNAVVQVLSIAHNITSSYHGQYRRLLMNGKYLMVAHAKGYKLSEPKTVIVPPDSSTERTQVNFYLQPMGEQGISVQSERVRVVQEKNYDVTSDPDAFIDSISKRYPNLTYVYSIGKSAAKKQDMRVLAISDNPTVHELGEPELKLIANIHGNEVVGLEMLASFARLLLVNYGVDEELTRLVDTTRIHFLLSANPDGRMKFLHAVGDKLSNPPVHVVEGSGRENGFNVDLNRDFLWNGDPNDISQMQSESQNIIRWTLDNPSLILSLVYHGGSKVVCYPYDDNLNKVHDIDTFQEIANNYVKSNAGMLGGYPCPKEYPKEKFPGGHLSGGHWYMFKGGMQDVIYNFTNCMEVTIEVSCLKAPPVGELPGYWEENRESLISFVKSAHIGVAGFVTDSSTGLAVPNCTIEVQEIPHNISCTHLGEYWRLLAPGSYHVAVHATGYVSERRTIEVLKGDAIPANFTLSPISNNTSTDAVAEITDISQLSQSYLDYTNFLNFIRALSQNYPHLVNVHYLGSDENGFQIPVVSVTAVSEEEQPKPRVALLSGVQATDQVTTAVIIRMLLDLCLKYQAGDVAVVKLLNGVTIEVVPTFYPASLAAGSNTCETDALTISENDLFFQFLPGVSQLTTKVKATRVLNFWLTQQDLAFSLSLLSGFSGTIIPSSCPIDYKGLATTPGADPQCNHYNRDSDTTDLADFMNSNFSLANMAIGVGCCSKPDDWLPNYPRIYNYTIALLRNVSEHVLTAVIKDIDLPVEQVSVNTSCGFLDSFSTTGVHQQLLTTSTISSVTYSSGEVSSTVSVTVTPQTVVPKTTTVFLNTTRGHDKTNTSGARQFMISLFAILLMIVIGWILLKVMLAMRNSSNARIRDPYYYQQNISLEEPSDKQPLMDTDSSEEEFSMPTSAAKLIPRVNKNKFHRQTKTSSLS